ncbi:hypothetical protein Tco_1061509, partial [Tanacetum coccineum]
MMRSTAAAEGGRDGGSEWWQRG